MLPNSKNANSQMQQLANNAVIAAKDKYGINLDYSENNLQQLELLLQQSHESYKQSSRIGNSNSISIENTVRVWGSYLGEVIRRSLGGDWIVDQKDTLLQIGYRRFDPLGQVQKRIVNGSLYNVHNYFQGLQTNIQDNLEEKRMTAIYTMKGLQALLEVFNDRVAITPKGILGFLNKRMKGVKVIPFTSIAAVQFKEAGAVFGGYLQFTLSDGIERRGGPIALAADENTLMFANAVNNVLAKEIKEYIDSAVRKSRTQ